MVGAFYRFCENNFIDFNDFLGEMSNPYEKVPKMDESTLKKWIVQVSTEMGKQLKSVRNSKSRRLINDAKNIVANRYMEKIILDNLKKSRAGKTTLLIAHRISTVEGLDKIIFLEDGRVEAVGPHDQLYASCPEYHKMVDLQKLEDEVGGGNA